MCYTLGGIANCNSDIVSKYIVNELIEKKSRIQLGMFLIDTPINKSLFTSGVAVIYTFIFRGFIV